MEPPADLHELPGPLALPRCSDVHGFGPEVAHPPPIDQIYGWDCLETVLHPGTWCMSDVATAPDGRRYRVYWESLWLTGGDSEILVIFSGPDPISEFEAERERMLRGVS